MREYFVNILAWRLCHEYFVMNTLSWILCHEYFGMITLAWILCHEYFGMNTLSRILWILAWILCQAVLSCLLDLSTCRGFIVLKPDMSRKRARLLEKRFNYFWNTCKELIQNKKKKTDPDPQLSSGVVLKEYCVGVSFLIDLQLC